MSTLVGGYSAEKPADAEVEALFGTAEVRSAVGAKLGEDVQTFVINAYKTQVVAGLKYKVGATVNGKAVVITAFKPLPHTGNPLEVQGVEQGASL